MELFTTEGMPLTQTLRDLGQSPVARTPLITLDKSD